MGNGLIEREVRANKLLDRSLALIRALLRGNRNNTFTLENPDTSFLFRMPGMRRLCRRSQVSSVILDQCMFGLRIPGCKQNEYVKKKTRFVGNVNLAAILLKCDGSHRHVHALGGVKTSTGWERRSALAGRYPELLCQQLEILTRAAHPDG